MCLQERIVELQQRSNVMQSRGIKEMVGSISPIISAVMTAINRLKENPEAFQEAMETAKSAIGIIKEGSKRVSEGAEELLLAGYLLNKASAGLFSKSRKMVKPIAENHVVDLETAEQFVQHSINI